MAVFTESLNKADGAGLGPDLTWSVDDPDGNWATEGNQGIINGVTPINIRARAEHDTGSSDMYTQVVLPDFGDTSYADLGICARMSADRQTYYALKRITASGGNPQWELRRNVAGVQIDLRDVNLAFALPETWRLEVEGGGILRVYRNDVLIDTVDDSALGIATGSFGGLDGFRNSTATTRRVIFDDFEVGSLTAGAITGSGTVTAPAATGSGAGSVTIGGSGSVIVPAAQVSGAGSVTVTGTGGLTSQAATVAGTGDVTVTGDGAVTAPAATVTGSGTIGTPAITGSGTVTAPAATIAGAATVTVGGAGTLTAAGIALTGAASVTVTGSGVFVAPAAVVAGSSDPPPEVPAVLTLRDVTDPLTLTNRTARLTLRHVEDA